MKENKIVSTFTTYKFILKILAAVILLAFAVLLFFAQDNAIFMLILITGGVIALQAIVRLIGIIKSKKCQQAKLITLVETLSELILGAYLIFAGFTYNNDPKSEFSLFNSQYYSFFLAGFLYVKTISYIWQVILYKVDTDKFKFWLHVFFISAAIFMAAIGNKFGAKEIVIALGIIALLCALLIGGEAGGEYFRYRKGKAPKKEKEKNEEVEDSNKIEAPGANDDFDISDIDPNIIPTDDKRDNDIIS